MAQAQFDHHGAGHNAGATATCTILASREWLRAEMAEDARSAGLSVGQQGALADEPVGRCDLILIDCPTAGTEEIAALQAITQRAAQADTALLVSASMASLEAVYASLPHGDVPLLVDPTRGERVIALGSVLATLPAMGVRELAETDRLTLLRLTEQVEQIAQRLDGLAGGEVEDARSAFRFGSPGQDYRGEEPEEGAQPAGKRPSLPDPRLIRSIIRQRQARAKFFGHELFADPAWDMLLDLTAAHAEHERVSVTSLCIASGVPPTTALRWITQMVEASLLERVQDSADKRRAFIRLSDRAVDGMARYFAEIAKEKVGRVV